MRSGLPGPSHLACTWPLAPAPPPACTRLAAHQAAPHRPEAAGSSSGSPPGAPPHPRQAAPAAALRAAPQAVLSIATPRTAPRVARLCPPLQALQVRASLPTPVPTGPPLPSVSSASFASGRPARRGDRATSSTSSSTSSSTVLACFQPGGLACTPRRPLLAPPWGYRRAGCDPWPLVLSWEAAVPAAGPHVGTSCQPEQGTT